MSLREQLVGCLIVLTHWGNSTRIDMSPQSYYFTVTKYKWKQKLKTNPSVKCINRWLWTYWICLNFLYHLTLFINISTLCSEVADDRLTKLLEMTLYWLYLTLTKSPKTQYTFISDLNKIDCMNFIRLFTANINIKKGM